MLSEHRFTIAGGRAHFRGVSFGHGDADPYVVFHNGPYMVLRLPGRRGWSSVGTTSYYPAQWLLVEVVPDGDGYYVARTIRDETPGRLWAATKADMLSEALAREMQA